MSASPARRSLPRPSPTLCRSFQAHNRSAFVGYNAYAVEPLLHELFLTSEHRTLEWVHKQPS